MGIFHYYDIGNAEIYVFDDFLIKQVKEGAFISDDDTELFVEIIEKHFKNKNFAFISNRVASYSVNPLVYNAANKIPNLVAFAVITNDEKMRETSRFENKFHNKPFELFENLSDTILWTSKIIKQEDEKKSEIL
ncbi:MULTISPECIES: hypothetical protein [unclassified Olleya]|jgi:hypothetical protein|uniref:hypothetical protein n=1 Tax=unclassified Olleya TaxID=2615019 RepID=UPI0011A68CA0|nr:hypothetical protein [Olleya sp. Hel_I_94]TVZ46811.1 hypothetical protein JM82_1395 [Olleya sp. Hel_I_94]